MTDHIRPMSHHKTADEERIERLLAEDKALRMDINILAKKRAEAEGALDVANIKLEAADAIINCYAELVKELRLCLEKEKMHSAVLDRMHDESEDYSKMLLGMLGEEREAANGAECEDCHGHGGEPCFDEILSSSRMEISHDELTGEYGDRIDDQCQTCEGIGYHAPKAVK